MPRASRSRHLDAGAAGLRQRRGLTPAPPTPGTWTLARQDDGNTVSNTNDTDRSLVLSVTDPSNVVTSKTYDSMRRPVTSQTGSSAITNSYSDDLLVGLSHTNTANTSTDYTLEYTTANLLSKVMVGSTYTLAENSYNPGTWTLARQDYGNGAGWAYSYSEFNDLTARWTTNGTSGVEFRCFYNSEGKLARVEQYDTTLTNGEITSRTLVNTERYYYDSGNRLTRVWETDASNNQHEFRWTYDSNDQVIELVETVNGQSFTYTNSYNGDKQPTQSNYDTVQKGFTYDGLGRLSQSAVSSNNSPVLTSSYTYRDLDTTRTTTQVSALQNSYGNQSESLTYTYDVKGNILSVSDGTHTTLYEYDTLNELVWEKNAAEGKAWHYSYDLGGNILSKEEYSYQNGVVGSMPLSTVTYTYGNANWPDLLTAYNGTPISYDGMGNPTSYRGWTFTWQGGRQLKSASKGTTSLSFQYNESGLRTGKTVGSDTYRYVYRCSTLVAEITGSCALYFHHDARGAIIGFTHVSGNTQTEYFYRKNLQGDVIGIVNASGNSVAEYRYDAWGQILSATGTMASVNPIRYRGYYYDTETGLYYLRIRYYDPQIGRFLNSDIFVSAGHGILGANMFAYCLDNPIPMIDDNGTDAIWIQEVNSAEGFGHSGLMIQDKDGAWYYFYWGPKREAEATADVKKLTEGVENGSYCIPVDTAGLDMKTVDGVTAAMERAGGDIGMRLKQPDGTGTIISICYFEGDYTNTLQRAKQFAGSSDQYQLLSQNCAQVSLVCMRVSDYRFYFIDNDKLNSTYPNMMFDRVMCLPRNKDAFWSNLLAIIALL